MLLHLEELFDALLLGQDDVVFEELLFIGVADDLDGIVLFFGEHVKVCLEIGETIALGGVGGLQDGDEVPHQVVGHIGPGQEVVEGRALLGEFLV